MAELIFEHQRLRIHGTQELEAHMTEVKDAIADLRSATITSALRPENQIAVDLKEISDRLRLLTADVESTALENRVLASLSFDQIQYRQETVALAHQKTFGWVLDPLSPTKLEPWLRTGSGIYWIKGKAGSGKSTLMKYLTTHPQTASALQSWAGARKVVTASFFFWNAGTELQKSQEGLFRSLLYEILRQSPELIRPICAFKIGRIRPFQQALSPWSLQELWHAARLLKEQSGVKTRFCFFIDGLDEYNGDPDQIIDVLQSLRSWPDIKICVSSRPWNEFQDAFGQPSDPQLALEDLTRNDIKNFVRSSLEENMRFRTLSARDARSQNLVQEVVEKAQGVFLWVVLVVKSLLNGLRNADRVSDLQKRLREFPATLEEYLGHIFASIDPFYRKQTAQTFKVALEAGRLLTLLTYSFLDEEDIDSILEAPANSLKIESILTRQDDMRRRLNGRCKGLLEVNVLHNQGLDRYADQIIKFRVNFLHRTARDFLLTKDMQKMIVDNLDPDFDVNLVVCKALFAQTKSLDYSSTSVPYHLTTSIFHEMIIRSYHIKSEIVQKNLLDAVGRFVVTKAGDFNLRRGSELGFVEYLVETGSCPYPYIAKVLSEKPHFAQSHRSALLVAELDLNYNTHRLKYYRDPEMIELILDGGASPNEDFKGSTIWGKFLEHKLDHELNTQPVVEALLSHGANPKQYILGKNKPADEFLLEVFGETRAQEILSKARSPT
ncbi:MAG: hypothetical protein Q9167_001766 [Letrouitia subvulpina]